MGISYDTGLQLSRNTYPFFLEDTRPVIFQFRGIDVAYVFADDCVFQVFY